MDSEDWSDWVEAQADPSLRCAQCHIVGFVMVQHFRWASHSKNSKFKNCFQNCSQKQLFTMWIWAALRWDQQCGICAQRNLRSAWASAQSNLSSLYAQWIAKDLSFHYMVSGDFHGKNFKIRTCLNTFDTYLNMIYKYVQTCFDQVTNMFEHFITCVKWHHGQTCPWSVMCKRVYQTWSNMIRQNFHNMFTHG